MQKVLLIHERGSDFDGIRRQLESDQFSVTEADTISAGLREIERGAFDHVITGTFPDNDTALALTRTLERSGGEWAVLPPDDDKLQRLLRALPLDRNHIVFEPVSRREMFAKSRPGRTLPVSELRCLLPLTGTSAAIVRARHAIEITAPDLSPVLITGETGTCKRKAARLIHASGPRSNKAFVVVDCASVPTVVMDRQLFGDDEREFSGGRLADAEGGTLVLEEITLLSPRTQQRLRDYLRGASGRGRSVNRTMKVIGTSRTPLVEAVARDVFDEDLYMIFREQEIVLPPLRERREDIMPLVDVVRLQLNERLSLNVSEIDAAAMELLMAYPWPSNAEELESVLTTAFVNCSGATVMPAHLPPQIRAARDGQAGLRKQRDYMLRQELIDVLNWAGWNKSKASRRLGISRETLYRRMEKYGLEDLEGK